MTRLSFFCFILMFCSVSQVQAANWNDPQGNLVRLPSEVTVSEVARPRDSLEEQTAEIVEQARIAMRRAAQMRKLQSEAEQQRKVVEMAAMERAEAAQQMRRRLSEQMSQDKNIHALAEQEKYEAQLAGMSPQDRRIYELALQERREAEKLEQDRRIYQQAMQEREDQRIRALALKEQTEDQDRRVRELALQEQQEVRDQQIRALALKEQTEDQDRRVRELAFKERQDARDTRLHELEQKKLQTVSTEPRRKTSAARVSVAPSGEQRQAYVDPADLLSELTPPAREEKKSVAASAAPEEPSIHPDTVEIPADHYLVGPGDLMFVSVWNDDALTRNLTVSPDGSFTFPLIGEVRTAGKTLPELKLELEQRLSPYVPDPVLSLELKQVNSLFIFVLGRVNNPGRFALNSPVNVLQALAIAGGLNPYAEKKKIQIIREQDKGTKVYPFNYKDVIKGRHLETNIRLQRGDVILVP